MTDVRIISAALIAILTGCVATQSQYNTTNMASTISQIREEQVLRNIASAIDDRSFVPSGIVLGTGQANVIVGFAPAMKTTNLNLSGAAVEVDVSPTDTWTAQWQFTSITDQGDLRRLRNVYALIVSTDEQYDTLVRYFRAKSSAAGGPADEATDNTVFRGLFDGLTPHAEPTAPKHEAVARPGGRASQVSEARPRSGEASNENAGSDGRQVIPWQDAKNFIVTGDSIDCRLFQEPKPHTDHGIPFRRWLFWRKPGGPWLPTDPGAPVQSIGQYVNWELGVTSRGCLDDFVILVQGVTPAASSVTRQGAKYMLQ